MRLLDQLERRFGWLAMPNATLVLIVLQVLVYLMALGRPDLPERLMLVPDKVLQGESWRVVTFLAMPPFGNLICDFFFWYLFYLMGTALEHTWGTFRYNLYLLIGFAATVGVAFAVPPLLPFPVPDWSVSNGFLEGSVFLAFAHLFPDFTLYLFFILPVRIKWLAMFTWIVYGLIFLFGEWTSRLVIGASVCNFLLFFGADIIRSMRYGRRRMAQQLSRLATPEKAYFHRCLICGITDRTNPEMDFRYCSQCAGACCYCADHLRQHEHVV